MLKRHFSHTRQLIVKELHLLFVAVMLLAGLGAAPAQLTQAGPDGGGAPEGLLNPDGTLDLSTGFQGTLDLRGWEVTMDSQRGPILKPAPQLAAASAPAWNALPNQGLSGVVWALAVTGSDLYVGGSFSETGDGSLTGLGRIARYDTAAGTWHALPNQGLNDGVCALTVAGSDLYVGGLFTQTGDGALTNLGGMARYDTTAATWHALPNQGLNGEVEVLAVAGSDLYVGGQFTQTGDGSLTDMGHIARYDTAAATWNALPDQGLSGYVYALAVNGSDLYVGGDFTQTGDGALTGLGYIARYDTTAGDWHALPNQGLDSVLWALAVVGSDLYAGGYFAQTGDGTLTDLGYVARYDTTAGTWNALPNQGLDNAVFALAVVGNDLYAAGYVHRTGDGSLTDLGRIARYDTVAGTWNALPNQGLNATIWRLAVVGSDLYVGGLFAQTDDGSLTNLGRIARYDTTTIAWRAAPNQGLNNDVRALAVDDSDLYVGGGFTQTGDGSLTGLGRIARYDTAASTWHALPNQGFNGLVRALAVVGSDLYVGGLFTQTGDGALTGLGYIARYDTTAGDWHALPNQGFNGYVYALAVNDSDLYAGGAFTQTGDGTVTGLGRIARYDTTAGTWHALPNQGFNSSIWALAASGSDLYAGGFFTQTGDGALTNLGYIARYDTAAGTWHALPNQGLNNNVLALAVDDSDLYVGGTFAQTGDGALTDLGRIARYDATSGDWQALPNQGLNGSVWALAASGSDLYVGGSFAQTGDGSLTDLGNMVRYDTTAGTWHALPNQGLNDYVYTMATSTSDLYAGGGFTQTGDGTVTGLRNIARYCLPPYELFLPLVLRG
jgi:N-acetylneuraminic acid mutarotase